MSSTEPPAGSNPPPGEPAPPPPPAADPSAAPPPPTNPGTYPPPPPPPAGATAPGVPGALYGPGHPGNLLDRFLARLIDSLIVGIPTGIVVGILTVASDSWLLTGLISGVLYAGAYLGYFGYFESSRGQGFGKQIMKLQVEGPNGGNPTMEQALRRNAWVGAPILYIIPILGPLVAGLIELVAVILCAVGINSDPQREHWFDKFAGGTRVVKIG
jgi:uncharacterized RDD family membrane protein YckC